MIFWKYRVMFLKLSIKLQKVNRRLVINRPDLRPGMEEEADGTFCNISQILIYS